MNPAPGPAKALYLDDLRVGQRFTTDCEVCCRPFEVVTECEEGEILRVETVG